jgi:hypothetical protein
MHFVSKFTGMVRLIGLLFLSAAHAAPKAAEPQPYTRTAEQRADKIVASLALASPATAARVRDVIARQYADLHALHAVRDARIAEAKSLPDRSAATAAVTAAKACAMRLTKPGKCAGSIQRTTTTAWWAGSIHT